MVHDGASRSRRAAIRWRRSSPRNAFVGRRDSDPAVQEWRIRADVLRRRRARRRRRRRDRARAAGERALPAASRSRLRRVRPDAHGDDGLQGRSGLQRARRGALDLDSSAATTSRRTSRPNDLGRLSSGDGLQLRRQTCATAKRGPGTVFRSYWVRHPPEQRVELRRRSTSARTANVDANQVWRNFWTTQRQRHADQAAGSEHAADARRAVDGAVPAGWTTNVQSSNRGSRKRAGTRQLT